MFDEDLNDTWNLLRYLYSPEQRHKGSCDTRAFGRRTEYTQGIFSVSCC